MTKQKSMGEWAISEWWGDGVYSAKLWNDVIETIISEHERRKRDKSKKVKK